MSSPRLSSPRLTDAGIVPSVVADDGVGDPTAALLWAACAPTPDLAACDRARAAGADVARAAEIAVGQRVSALLWRVVHDWEPGPWTEELGRDVKRIEARAGMLLPRLADAVLEPLAVAGLPPLVLKGAALVDRYPSRALRPMDDIDLLVPPGQRAAVVRVLRDHGWTVVPREGDHYETVLVHPEFPGFPVEVHVELDIPREQAFRLRAADLWASREAATILGAPAFALPPEAELLAIATHAAKPFHIFDRLLWSVDIAVVIERAETDGPGVDWRWVQSQAARARADTALAVALTHAARLGVATPAALRRVSAPKVQQGALAPVLGPDWPVVPRTGAMHNRLSYALIDDPLLQLRLAKADVFAGGLTHVPVRAANLTWRAARRWAALQLKPPRSTRQASPTMASISPTN